MRIEKVNSNQPNRELEKIRIEEKGAVFILYDPQHKPIIQVFQGV